MKRRLQQLYIKKFINNLLPYHKVIFTNESFINLIDNVVSINTNFTKEDLEFNDFTEQEFGIRINYLLISILHEVGHYYSFTRENHIDKELKMVSINLKAMLAETDAEISAINNEYWRLPLEKEATRWGIEFYKANKEFCENFLKKLHLSIDTNA